MRLVIQNIHQSLLNASGGIFRQLENKGYEASKKEQSVLGCLLICREAAARGIIFDPINLDKSDSKNFVVGDNGHLIPPFRTIDGLGETVSNVSLVAGASCSGKNKG